MQYATFPYLKYAGRLTCWPQWSQPPTPAPSQLGCRPMRACCPVVWPWMAKVWEMAALTCVQAAIEPISPVSAGLPGARSAVAVLREWSEKKEPQAIKSHLRTFLSSLLVEEKSRSTKAVRQHWSVENRNHHKRDASAWQEDRHRHRRPYAAL